MFRASQFGKREIINLTDGERMGYVCDLEIDEETGKINALIVPSKEKISVFSKGQKIVIPWQSIKKIGDDIILVTL